ncbi:PREDICTED: AT-rich interactive domain-containing protein 3B isoform X1 [Poecilia mexicana]|uniref:AT-rich interactive domain-containing protein 3B isoform X1 n=1 Tax=Poecilia mexicana TaxID=48701 RepID=UPI00072EC8DB|nr:PREDICTED: AT-rich interactive domain-containing protein 3B isoform X1 [Poecilia mexicana]
MNYSRAQMSNLSEEGSLQQSAPAGVKLGAVMEQLQRHPGAKLEMNLQEKHFLQAQFLLAHQAAAARGAGGSRPDPLLCGEPDGPIHQTVPNQREPKQESEDSDGEQREMLEPGEGDELEEEGDERKMSFQHVSHFQPYSAELKSEPSPSAVKEEQEEKNLLPPAGQSSFTSPSGLADWGYDELFKLSGVSIKQTGLGPLPVNKGTPVHRLRTAEVKMPRSNQLSETVRRRIIDLHSSGNGYKRISKELSVHRSTIRKIIYKWRKFRTVSTLPRSGRPRKNAPEGRCAAQKERGSGVWTEESDGAKARGEPSRDFAKLYELDSDPQRKEFLDELFVFMQKRGTPVNRIPIMAKQVLDLYRLYKLVTEKGGLVEVINKKIWREITKGLNLPTSITSAAFTLRTQYMKYLYPFECDKKGLSSPGELQVAIDSNRREGRRPSYTSSLYRYSPSQTSAPHSLLASPIVHTPPTAHNGINMSLSAGSNLKRTTDENSTPTISRLPMALGHHHQQQQQQQQHSHPHHQLAQPATLEHLRERLDRAAGGAPVDGPEKKMMRLAEEQQRLMQQALQQNLLAMASHLNPVSLKLNNGNEKKKDLSLSISTNGPASISVSVEVNGTVYSGTLLAQKTSAPVSSQTVTPAGTSGFSALFSSHSPSFSSSTSSKGPN